MGKKSKRQRPGKAAGSRREAIIPARRDREEAIRQTSLEDLREKADFHKMMVTSLLKATSSESKKICSYVPFKAYCDVLVQGSKHTLDFLADQDHRLLKAVCKSDEVMSIEKALAYGTRGELFYFNSNFDDATQCMIRAIRACVKASEKERRDSGDILYAIHKQCQASVSAWRGTPLISVDQGTGKATPVSASFVGGNKCDACGISLEELGLAKMDCCSVCQLTYYCSTECQKVHWKIHKKECRKPGEFKAGDTAIYRIGHPGVDSAFVTLVRVLEDPALDGNGHVLVEFKHKATFQLGMEDPKYLRRCRPAVWNCHCPKGQEGFNGIPVAKSAL